MDLDLSKRSKPCFKKNRTMSMGKVKNPFLKVCGIGLLTVICISVKAQKVNFTVNSKTGAIQSMNIDNDKQNMNWLIATDGSQYPWIKENYGWGLGYFTEVRRNQKNKLFWNLPASIKQDGREVTYRVGDICIRMFSFEILEVQFDFPHIFIKISRRHNCFSGRYGLCTIVNTYQNDRHLSLKGDVIKPFFPVRVRLAGSFGCDSQMKLFAFSKMMNHLIN